MQTQTHLLKILVEGLPYEKKVYLSLQVSTQEKITQLIIADAWPNKPTIEFFWSRLSDYMLLYHPGLVRDYIARIAASLQEQRLLSKAGFPPPESL